MMLNPTGHLRKSFMDFGGIYFWTATINGWQCLLRPNHFKDEIIGSLRILSERGKIDVFGFTIMPNHMHLIWRIKERNGRETPQGSLLKFTGHQFKKMLIEERGYEALRPYAVDAHNKLYEFWQRDSLAIPLFTRPVAFQKLTYMHHNPLVERWKLASTAEEYKYSSARYYATGIDEFGLLKNLNEEFLFSQR
jgi:REP element-mobilizing transposase RayT